MADLDTANIAEKMKFGRNRILHRIRRRGHVGRLQLARALRMSNSRVCQVVQEMLDEGLVLEEFSGNSRRGRRPVPLHVNPDHGRLLGLDFEAKRMRVVAVDLAGGVTWEHREPLAPVTDRQDLIDCVLGLIDDGIARVRGDGRRLLGIGLAAPGIIDRRTGTMVHYDFIEAARDIPLRDLVASHTGLPCAFDNNIRAYALAEWTSGAAQHLTSFVCLAVCSGVGAAIMQDGHLLGGSHGLAGEAGYIAIPNDKAASGWKTFHELVSEQALGLDVESETFELSDTRAQRAGELVGAQLATFANLLDPEAIVLAGKLIQPDGPLWPWLERTYRRFVLPDLADRVQLLPARAGPFAAAIGAAHRCFQLLYPVGAETYS